MLNLPGLNHAKPPTLINSPTFIRSIMLTTFGPIMDRSESVAQEFILYEHESVG